MSIIGLCIVVSVGVVLLVMRVRAGRRRYRPDYQEPTSEAGLY